jgi:SulP family sulfate permease
VAETASEAAGAAPQSDSASQATSTKATTAGTFAIETGLGYGIVADVKGGSTSNKANVQIYRSNNTSAQRWRLEFHGNVCYVVNVKSGGRTQLSGMVHALLLLAIMLGLGSVVQYVPLSVLAGILITVGWGIIDFKGFKDLPKIPRADAVVLIVVFLVTVFVDLLTAVGIGMVIACVLFMKRASDLVEGGYSSQELTNFDKESPWDDEHGMPDTVAHKIYVQRLNGPIFFGTINKFKEVMATVPVDAKIVIIRMRLVSFMDQSGLYAMEEAIKEIQANGTQVLMTIIQPQPLYMLTTHKVIPGVVPEDHTFKTFEDCTEYLKKQINK